MTDHEKNLDNVRMERRDGRGIRAGGGLGTVATVRSSILICATSGVEERLARGGW